MLGPGRGAGKYHFRLITGFLSLIFQGFFPAPDSFSDNQKCFPTLNGRAAFSVFSVFPQWIEAIILPSSRPMTDSPPNPDTLPDRRER